MTSKSNIRVFLASPGDILEERDLFREALGSLSSTEGQDFEPLGWEDLQAESGTRPQGHINELVDQCDVFVGVFHKRWGQAAPDSVVHTSYTEEEFQRARGRLAKSGSPEILLFFKHLDVEALSDPGPQLSKVLRFRRQLEASGQVLYRTYSRPAEFIIELKRHLLALSLSFEAFRDQCPRAFHLPELADREPETDRREDLALAQQARIAFEGGHREEASVLYARLTQRTRNLEVLEQARQFFLGSGNVEAAAAIMERRITLLKDRRLAAREHISVMKPLGWLDELTGTFAKQRPPERQSEEEAELRRRLADARFNELLIEALAEHFTVGELLGIARYYRNEGASTNDKMPYFMGSALPKIFQTLERERKRRT